MLDVGRWTFSPTFDRLSRPLLALDTNEVDGTAIQVRFAVGLG
jgi:hypothetical protein